jgi:hypothetical protein
MAERASISALSDTPIEKRVWYRGTLFNAIMACPGWLKVKDSKHLESNHEDKIVNVKSKAKRESTRA